MGSIRSYVQLLLLVNYLGGGVVMMGIVFGCLLGIYC